MNFQLQPGTLEAFALFLQFLQQQQQQAQLASQNPVTCFPFASVPPVPNPITCHRPASIPIPVSPIVAGSPLTRSPTPATPRTPMVATVEATSAAMQFPQQTTTAPSTASGCDGTCDDLACTDVVVTNGAVNAAEWLRLHGIMSHQKCAKHPVGPVRQGQREGQLFCAAKNHNGSCRAQLSVLAFFTPKENYAGNTAETLLTFLCCVARKESINVIASRLNKHRNTVLSALYEKLYHAVGHYQHRRRTHQFTNVQVDETYIGKRKYNAGKAVRGRHHWVVTLTQGSVTLWYLVETRTKEVLEEIIRRHLAPDGRAVVTTDGWRGYVGTKNIPGVAEHHVVIHKAKGKRHTFTNSEGRHINNAESAHSSVKRTMKQMFFHYGKGAKSLQRNISIATLLYNKSPAERLKSLLEAVRDWDGTSFVYEDVGMIEDPPEMQDDDEPVGDDDDDCSVEEVEPDDEVEEVERTGAPPRKSHRAEKPPAEQPSTDDLSEDMATQRALIAGLSAERSLAYASVVATNAEFDCFAVELLLCHVLQGHRGSSRTHGQRTRCFRRTVRATVRSSRTATGFCTAGSTCDPACRSWKSTTAWSLRRRTRW
jgi:transposase-like protein